MAQVIYDDSLRMFAQGESVAFYSSESWYNSGTMSITTSTYVFPSDWEKRTYFYHAAGTTFYEARAPFAMMSERASFDVDAPNVPASGSPFVRELNTLDAQGVAGLIFNPTTHQVTLPAGDYYAEGWGSFYRNVGTFLLLQDTAGTPNVLVNGEFDDSATGSPSLYSRSGTVNIHGYFTLAASTVLELRQHFETLGVTDGMGIGRPENPYTNMYSMLRITRLK